VYVFELKIQSLAGREGAGIDNVGGILLDLLVGLKQRRAGKGHQTSPGGLEDTEGSDQLEERVDTGRLSRAVKNNESMVIGMYESGRKVLTPRQCSCWC
jgi:hypothetical protein